MRVAVRMGLRCALTGQEETAAGQAGQAEQAGHRRMKQQLMKEVHLTALR